LQPSGKWDAGNKISYLARRIDSKQTDKNQPLIRQEGGDGDGGTKKGVGE